MYNKIYSLPVEPDEQHQVNEPEISYSVLNDNFEKDWQRGMSVKVFKKRVLENPLVRDVLRVIETDL